MEDKNYQKMWQQLEKYLLSELDKDTYFMYNSTKNQEMYQNYTIVEQNILEYMSQLENSEPKGE